MRKFSCDICVNINLKPNATKTIITTKSVNNKFLKKFRIFHVAFNNEALRVVNTMPDWNPGK